MNKSLLMMVTGALMLCGCQSMRYTNYSGMPPKSALVQTEAGAKAQLEKLLMMPTHGRRPTKVEVTGEGVNVYFGQAFRELSYKNTAWSEIALHNRTGKHLVKFYNASNKVVFEFWTDSYENASDIVNGFDCLKAAALRK